MLDVAKIVFARFDDGDNSLTYKELKTGLTTFGVFFSHKEFHSLCRMIDPDQSGGPSR